MKDMATGTRPRGFGGGFGGGFRPGGGTGSFGTSTNA
jgi:hypothetical protein